MSGNSQIHKSKLTASRNVLCVVTMAIGLVPASAQSGIERKYSATFNQCMEVAGSETAEMRACYASEISLQDGRLNQAYVMVMRKLSPLPKMQLRRSERAWIIRRDATCNRRASENGGRSLNSVTFDDCYLAEIVTRRFFLEGF